MIVKPDASPSPLITKLALNPNMNTENTSYHIQVPELKLKVPKEVVDQMGDMQVPLYLVITYPARQELNPTEGGPSSGDRVFEICPEGLEVHWKIHTCVSKDEAESPAHSPAHDAHDSTADTILLSDNSQSPVQSQSIL